MTISRYLSSIEILFALMVAGLLTLGSPLVFVVAYVAIFVFATVRTIITPSRISVKFWILFAYFFVLVLQVVVCQETLVKGAEGAMLIERFFQRVLCALIMMLPVVVSRYITVGKYSRFYLPSLHEVATISFSELKSNSGRIVGAVNELGNAGKRLSPENLKTIIDDIPRHSSFRYVNNGSLSDEYFADAEKYIDDPHIYIIVSNTGSAASQLISVFTQKEYNHASLSFDRDLKTIISYNGGETVYPPGLNHEMIEFFNKKPDSSIIVYKLQCTREQKRIIMDKVREINSEGSAYNMMGLVLKYSHKPNIMFCSQFVYNMLQYAGLTYFTKKDGNVEPTDLIELDYHRKLQFDYEIFMNQAPD